MSLLADLLSKVKRQGENREVPPGLKRIVSDSTGRNMVRRKIIISSFLSMLAVAGGIGTVYVIELYPGPSKTVTGPQPVKKPADHPLITASPNPAAVETSGKKENQPLTGTYKTAPPERVSLTAAKRLRTEAARAPESASPQPAPRDQPEKPTTAQAEAKQVELKDDKPRNSKGDRDLYLYTARTYESQKEYQQAFLNYKKALETDNGNFIIMNNMSGVLLHMGNPEEALKYAKYALGIRKDYVPSLVNLGIAHIHTGNLPEGEGCLSKALLIEPLNSYAILNLGLLFERRGDNDKAYNYFIKLSETGDIQGNLGIARIHEKQGRGPSAARVYRDIISTNGVDADTKKTAMERLLRLGQ